MDNLGWFGVAWTGSVLTSRREPGVLALVVELHGEAHFRGGFLAVLLLLGAVSLLGLGSGIGS